VVVTGSRARALDRLLADSGWTPVPPPRLPRYADLSTSLCGRIGHLYDLLGGVRDQLERIRPGGWDLAFETRDGLLLVELDEEQHFNRYRAMTFTATRDLELPWTPNYEEYCRAHERHLLPGWGTGKRWTNPSAARFFGEPDAPGDFCGVGAPRWRQRAFYDAVKDVLTDRRLARISVHDELEDGVSVEALLRRTETANPEALRALVEGRVDVS
jgi:hypothetical protein